MVFIKNTSKNGILTNMCCIIATYSEKIVVKMAFFNNYWSFQL